MNMRVKVCKRNLGGKWRVSKITVSIWLQTQTRLRRDGDTSISGVSFASCFTLRDEYYINLKISLYGGWVKFQRKQTCTC